MIYCRWLVKGSDVSCFRTVEGLYVINVASVRYKPEKPPPELPDLALTSLSKWTEEYRKRERFLEGCPHSPLPARYAGKRIESGSAGECAERLERLRGSGFVVPEGVIEMLQLEASPPKQRQAKPS